MKQKEIYGNNDRNMEKIIKYPTQNIITNEKTKGKLIWTDREIDKE